MNINLANIDFCPGEGGGTPSEVKLAPTTAEILLSETEKVILPPSDIDGFNKVTITHAPVEESVSTTITSNGTRTITPSEGFGAMFGVNVDVNVPSKPEVAKDIVITENGNTTYTPNEGEVFNRVNVDVNVSSSGDTMKYFYKKPTADDVGLKAIGWNDDDVNYYKYNNYAYPWEADNYKVSDANKQIVINSKSDIATYKSNPNFKYCPKFDTSNVTDMSQMFYNCSFLVDIPQLDTHSVTNMNYMFSGCSSLTTIPQLDTSKVAGMQVMFYNCSHLTTIPLLDTRSVTNMSSIFDGCRSLTSIPPLDTSNVTYIGSMFKNCESLTSIPQLDTSKVTNMNTMFYGCSSLTTILQMDTSNVTSMNEMFHYCSSLITIPQLDTSKVTNMSNMFTSCSSIISIPKLDATSLTAAGDMFGAYYYPLRKFTTFGGLTNLKVNLGLSSCEALTHDSLMNVINEAADVTASPKTLTLGTKNLNKLTDEEKAIATNKGWTLA